MRDFQYPGRSAVLAQNGMCATSHPLAASVAVDILKSGGNAVDAAIAGAVLLGICEPQMTGIGGDCFVLFTSPGDGSVHALNGSGRAPKGLSADALRAAGNSTVPVGGAPSVTVPGAIDAFCRLSADWGRVGLDRVLAPAIHYAEAGVPVAPRAAFDWARDAAVLQGRARDLYMIEGSPGRVGQVFKAPAQAEVLRRIALDGRRGFYEGDVAEDMVSALRAAGGTHTSEDFAATSCDYTDPIMGTYKGAELWEHPPNGQGATAILLTNILSRFDLPALDPLGAERIHIEAEATKLAYNARNRILADPDHTARLEHMLATDTAAQLAALIELDRAMPDPAPLTEAIHRDTIYITVVDRDLMKVSLIYSIFNGFGSGLASDKYGILFQNRGAGFNLIPGHPNEAGPCKRPMHTIIPGMLGDGIRITTPFGVMGGQYQSTGHARFLSNIVDFGMDPQSAIDSPRAFATNGELQVECGYPDTVRVALSDKGHNVVVPDKAIGGAQAIRVAYDSGILEGASDPRKDGCAIGY